MDSALRLILPPILSAHILSYLSANSAAYLSTPFPDYDLNYFLILSFTPFTSCPLPISKPLSTHSTFNLLIFPSMLNDPTYLHDPNYIIILRIIPNPILAYYLSFYCSTLLISKAPPPFSHCRKFNS